jgi:uncharacterized protein YjbJ (UPF0337 family)
MKGSTVLHNKRRIMNEDRVKGNWKQFKGKIKEKWGLLTEDELDVAEGRRDQLIGKIQERRLGER